LEWVLCCACAWAVNNIKPAQNIADVASLLMSTLRNAIRTPEIDTDVWARSPLPRNKTTVRL
jgi:hypothetical protein